MISSVFSVVPGPRLSGGWSIALGHVDENDQRSYGATDASICVTTHALGRKWPVDVFVCISDGESWAGSEHASQALVRYRQTMGIDAKMIYINMVANRTSLKDPADSGSLDVVGFDASVPPVAGFIGGQVESTAAEDSE